MQKLKKIYAEFSPVPLQSEQQNLYVDLNSARGDALGIVRQLQRKIELSDKPTCQVLTGHRGSGKSTELWQLQHHLQDPGAGEKRFVVFVRADDHMDRNDIDFPEVLIALVKQLVDELEKRENITLKPGYFKDRWARLKSLFGSDIDFDNITLSVGLAKISMPLKNSPDVRQALRKQLDADAGNWLTAANEVIAEAKLALSKKGYQDLVIIVDDLDKMITRQHESAECTTTEYLFVHRAAQLSAFQCHIIYTIPLELAYSHHESTLKELYGGAVPVIPMTKIATPPPNAQPHEAGLNCFRKIIQQRLQQAGAEHADLFADAEVETALIQLSGGQPTELMTLIREAIIAADLPIQLSAVERGRTEALRSYRRQLRPEHWPILQQAQNRGQVTRTVENEQTFRQLLESRALLLYRNGEEWYAPHPVVAELTASVPSETQPVGD